MPPTLGSVTSGLGARFVIEVGCMFRSRSDSLRPPNIVAGRRHIHRSWRIDLKDPDGFGPSGSQAAKATFAALQLIWHKTLKILDYSEVVVHKQPHTHKKTDLGTSRTPNANYTKKTIENDRNSEPLGRSKFVTDTPSYNNMPCGAKASESGPRASWP